MNLLAVNIASPKPITVANRSFETGIFKETVEKSVFVNELGLQGDAVVDTKHHGGLDQAVYIYSDEDYAFWATQLGAHPQPGTFGENLTVSSFATAKLYIGDRLQIGEVILEVSAPRIPCATFAKKMDDMNFVKTFKAAKRPGAYARVIKTGNVTAGDSVSYIPAQKQSLSLVEFFDLYYEKDLPKETLEQLLAAPIDIRSRKSYAEKLDKIVSA